MSWFDKLTVDCIHGDLLQADTETLACNVNVMLNLNYSIGQQLLKRYGNSLAQELDIIRKRLPAQRLELGQALWVDNHAGKRPLIFFGWWDRDNDFTVRLIYTSFVNTLREAFAHDCRSIAFPLFGTGSGSMCFNDFQESISKALQELNRLKGAHTFSVEEIVFFSTNKERIEPFSATLDRILM